jgi:hypothetical protein
VKKPKLVKHRTGPGPNDFVMIKKTGVEPVRFLPVLKKVFGNMLFLDPHGRHGVKNLIYVAASVGGWAARVYVRRYGPDGRLVGVFQPVRLFRGDGVTLSRADVLTWYRCMREVYNDLGLGLPVEELEHTLHCMDAAGKLTSREVAAAVKWLRNLYAQENTP